MQVVNLATNETIARADNILATIAQTEQKTIVPPGYVPVKLSTKGKLGAPALFHIRNFSVKDMMALALTEENDLPERVVEILSSLIYENVDVKAFHENEIIETLLNLYVSFFSPILTDVDFPVTEEDYEYIRAHSTNPEEAESKIQALKNGAWVPKTDIDIIQNVDTYDIPDDFCPTVTIRYKKTNFSVAFSIPRYGDVLIVKKWLTENFEEKERKFATVAKLLELRNKMIAKHEAGEAVDLSKLPIIDPQAEAAYNALQLEKATALVDVIRALHLVGFDGNDVSKLPLSERIKLIQDPRIDITIAKKLDKYFENLTFGIKPEVRMLNPITGKLCTRRFSFRLVDILQAIQLSETDEYDIIFGNEFQS